VFDDDESDDDLMIGIYVITPDAVTVMTAFILGFDLGLPRLADIYCLEIYSMSN